MNELEMDTENRRVVWCIKAQVLPPTMRGIVVDRCLLHDEIYNRRDAHAFSHDIFRQAGLVYSLPSPLSSPLL